MRKIRTAVFAGIAALAVVGTAVAASHDNHVMNLDLPDGSIARIEYKGDVAPKVTVAPALNLVPVHWIDPLAAAPFTMSDRIAANMDRQTDMMMRQVRSLQLQANAGDGKVDLAAFRALPPGTVSYSFVSTENGQGTCTRSVEVTTYGQGQPPKVVSNSSGTCHVTSATRTVDGSRGQDKTVTSTAVRTAASREGRPLQTT